ncbi:hypothetical protein SAMN04488029_3187 [Reichenbachiella faecimaris]|uniref:HEAT repeat-containing protein n=1 Tax=Reichenbachiella faecimaris TaxID=692418 RepID=A0A1W2GL44_REIFA|nr:HEAT repeat domain-containing protein [Reichenbachiella faecimaris]SMD37006.1 hypothetical protein SAMN04488029_3187 [Reichenbachiella faecimaris]
MSSGLKIFREDFLNANTWPQRKDGVPLDLLDNLNSDELRVAENELIAIADTKDDWPIKGLGHIKSEKSLPKLYELLKRSKKLMKVTIAEAIYQICGDEQMINIALTETPKISNEFALIDVMYTLSKFQDGRVKNLLNDYRNHTKYLVAYNATQALGLPTEPVVDKFRDHKPTSFWNRITSPWNN